MQPGDEPIARGNARQRGARWLKPRGSVDKTLRRRTGGSVLPELAAIACFLVLLWTSIGLALTREYASDRTAAIQTTANLARAFEESTRRMVGQIDQALLSLRAVYAAEGAQFDLSAWARAQTPPDAMTTALGMADQTGRMFANTLPMHGTINVADRTYFQAQRDPAHDRLFISAPVRGRISGQDIIQFSRKLMDPHGAFNGVAVLSLGCGALSQYYQTLDLGKGFVSLMLNDGTILAHGPMAPGLIGQSVVQTGGLAQLLSGADGTITFHSRRSNVQQMASYRRLRDYPLVVMVGTDADTAFAPYRALRHRAIAAGVVISGVICLISVLWLRQKRRSVLSRRSLAITLETISQGILMLDGRGRVPVANGRAMELLGVGGSEAPYRRQEAAKRALQLAAGHAGTPDDGAAAATPDTRFETIRDDGTVIEVHSHALSNGGFVQTYMDVTEQRLADARVRFLAHHDTLTGLANRAHLRQRLPDFLAGNAESGLHTAFLMIDLDGFKGINDTLGHEIGDELLVEAARRLQGLVRAADFVARLGGDEFVVLLPGLRQPEAALPLAQRILQRLSEPVQVDDHRLRIGASIGMAFHPRDAESPDALFKHADIALYAAKAQGRGTFCCFDPGMTHAVNERRRLEAGLRRAVEHDELLVHFQPIFAADSMQIAGFEALTRWRDAARGFVSPETFIRIAEECGLIYRLGLSVIEYACAAAAGWQTPHRIAVNVSIVQLREGRLQQDIADILRRTGLAPTLLELEVTESVLADNNQAVMDTLNDLKGMGIRIALDDFGTGYSSLSYLRRFPFDKIKIDKSFVQGQSNDQGVRVILESILEMCRKLGLQVVGEGVETPQQLAMLRQHGCTEVQGYLMARPMPADQVDEYLRGQYRLGGTVPVRELNALVQLT